MKQIDHYAGPYLFKSGTCKGRSYMQIFYTDGSKGTMLYSRWLMENTWGEN